MGRNLLRSKRLILLLVTLTLSAVALAGWVLPGALWSQRQSTRTISIDIDHARQVFQSGGELTYEEVLALKRDLVGESPKSTEFTLDEYDVAYDRFQERKSRFTGQLQKCRLKESIGWVAYRLKVPEGVVLYMYMYDPFSEFDGDSRQAAELYILGLGEEQVREMKYGQRIRFSGQLSEVDRFEYVVVKNVTYELLEDDISMPTPSADELKDLRIVLERVTGLGNSPTYTLTITGDGHVTFEGGLHSRVSNTTARVDRAKILELIREFKKADFFSLSDRYLDQRETSIYTLSLRMGGRSKTVINLAGVGPRRLAILQDRIDQIVDSYQWLE
jgi:hypothetical protein